MATKAYRGLSGDEAAVWVRYFIYLAEDFRFGTFGPPWELSLCVFGGDLLDLVEADLHEVLGQVMRRDGRQAPV